MSASPDIAAEKKPSSQALLTVRAGVRRVQGGVMRIVDAILPPRCPSCGEEVEATGLICGKCWPDLRIMEPPWCQCCGVAFDFEGHKDDRCLDCLSQPPAFDHARAAFAYEGVARQLVLGLKHADKLFLAPFLAPWLGRAVAAIPELPAGSIQVVPVPLHWRRMISRKHNQSAELARNLVRWHGRQGAATDRPVLHYEPLLVRRRRATPPQGSPKAPSRRMNIRGAFEVTRPAKVANAHILIVDDVMTTGATVNELAKTLKRAGAARVDVVTVTRVGLND
ncbi:MAG: ComF family protein [Alphaproteobacteria bacterium]|nr:ComF family protein [Alphaproteobacteria bacterium SS10]